MSSVNKVILVGRIGQDPDVRNTSSGSTVVNLNLATSERRKEGGGSHSNVTYADVTEWHRVAVFGKAAEFAANYLQKGDLVYVEGNLRTRKYTDKAGIERSVTEVACMTLQSLSSKSQGKPQKNAEREPKARPQSNFDSDIPFANPYRGKYAYAI